MMQNTPRYKEMGFVSGSRSITRREFVGRAALAGAGVGLTQLGWPLPVLASHIDYTSREAFDLFLSTFESMAEDRIGQSTDLNEDLGSLAWGQSYIQQGLLRMYDAYGDRGYLDHLVGNIDDVLATRDSERGVTDYRGLSLPAWRGWVPYTMGAVDLADAGGRPLVQIRSVRTPIERLVTIKPLEVEPNIEVEVEPGALPDTFRLVVRHGQFDVVEEYDDLSLDPTSADYVVDRLRAAWPTFNSLTAMDLREDQSAGDVPAEGVFTMSSQFAVFGVHTGMITYAIAGFARLVMESPPLRRRYGDKAEEYVEACEAAVAVHDHEWRENDQGEGWYDFARGSPVGFDGAEQPANQFLALGRTVLHLAAVTGKPVYADRAAKMATTLRNLLVVDDDRAYVWPYWPTWGRVYNGWEKDDDVSEYRLSYCCATQIEDISHAHIDVDFAVLAFRDHVVFTGRDMQHLAKTFTRNVATTDSQGPTVWSNVDATGAIGSDTWGTLSGLWMPLAPFDEDIFHHISSVYNRVHMEPDDLASGFKIIGVGNLASWAGRDD